MLKSATELIIEPANANWIVVSIVCTTAPVLRFRTKKRRFWLDLPRNWLFVLSIGPVGPDPNTTYHSPFRERSRSFEAFRPLMRMTAGPVVVKPRPGFVNSHSRDGFVGSVTSSAKYEENPLSVSGVFTQSDVAQVF